VDRESPDRFISVFHDGCALAPVSKCAHDARAWSTLASFGVSSRVSAIRSAMERRYVTPAPESASLKTSA